MITKIVARTCFIFMYFFMSLDMDINMYRKIRSTLQPNLYDDLTRKYKFKNII